MFTTNNVHRPLSLNETKKRTLTHIYIYTKTHIETKSRILICSMVLKQWEVLAPGNTNIIDPISLLTFLVPHIRTQSGMYIICSIHIHLHIGT